MRGIMRIYLRRFDIALVIFRGFCSLYGIEFCEKIPDKGVNI